MVKNHLKRISAPKTWLIGRKNLKFIARPNSGAHSLSSGVALSTLMKEMLDVAETTKQVKFILNNKGVLVDGIPKKDVRLSVGLMDVISFPESKQSYRILLDNKGRLAPVSISEKESKLKLSRIEGKTKISGGKTQLNLFDGKNIIIDKDTYKTGDVIEIELPGQKILNHYKFDTNVTILLIGGKHSGDTGKIEEINENKIIYSSKSGERYETLRNYAFVIGNDKSVIKLE